MGERTLKGALAAELVLVLLPATVLLGTIAWLSYAAYPRADPRAAAIAFDAAMLAAWVGFAAAWRLLLAGVRRGSAAFLDAPRPWRLLLTLGALAALAANGAAIEQWLNPAYPSPRVGFALLAPAMALVLIELQVRWVRRARKRRSRARAQPVRS